MRKIKGMRFHGKAKCTGYGSMMRSALAPFEHPYVEFAINGVRYHWFNEKAEWERPFKNGKWYDISCGMDCDRMTLQRVKIISGPHEEDMYL